MAAFGIRRAAEPDRRGAPREEVYHRTRGVLASGGSVPLQVVNVSATGFMARTEAELEPGTRLQVRLPVVGERPAEVRWALAGRIGCQFDRPVDLADYLGLLGALARESN